MICDYDGFEIESYEMGKGLWHARIQRADRKPVILDGTFFSVLEVGFAWSSPDAAIADARNQVDRLIRRYPRVQDIPHAELPAGLQPDFKVTHIHA